MTDKEPDRTGFNAILRPMICSLCSKYVGDIGFRKEPGWEERDKVLDEVRAHSSSLVLCPTCHIQYGGRRY